MKIAISYPAIKSEKGTPLLSQNRQFQWFHSPTYIYPMVPASAATLLKENGYDVFWDDGIAEELSYEDWKERILKEKPDLIAIETKTPVIKRHWQIINQLKVESYKVESWRLKVVLMGDHVTALPEESLQKCAVDFVLTSGDYDFMLLNLANHLTRGEKLEPGWYYRSEKLKVESEKFSDKSDKIISTEPFQLKHNLDSLPMIDRNLTKWKLYAFKNGNFKRTPGTYMMSARDCWWGRCTFCLTSEAQILTINGAKAIKDIEKGENVLTHLGKYKKVNDILRRSYDDDLLEIKANCLIPFRITPNHQVLSLPASKVKRCPYPGNWAYVCKESKYSKRLDCASCRYKYYLDYKPEYAEAGHIKKGDFLAVPISREIDETEYLDLIKILDLDPTLLKTWKKIKEQQIFSIIRLCKSGKSEREISSILNLDRETVHRYIILEREGLSDIKINPLARRGDEIRFEGGKKWILAKIKLDRDIFRLFGYYLAEGHVHKLKNRPNSLVLGFTFSQKEKDYIEDVQKIFKNNFEIAVNIHQNNRNHTTQITVGNTLLAKVFKNLFGDNCYNKNLPEFIVKAEREKQVELLRGIFRGDAHYRKRGKRAEYILNTVADSLASQLVMLLLRCSAIPSVRKSKLGKKMTKSQNIIALSSVDIINLFGEEGQEIKPGSIYKRGFIVGDYAYLPVMRLNRKRYQGEVYNLSVDEDHSYTVNFIGVSNCSWTTLFPGGHFRTRSAVKALDEVGQLIKLGVKEIMEDSGSLPIGPWLKEFCQGMIVRGYNKKVIVSCNMRINGIKDPAVWQLMKKAGFRMILFGLESANQETLNKINKGLKVEEIEPCLKMCKEAGLSPHITAMLGYPWETKEEVEKTIALAKKLFKKGYVDTLQATIVIPYPGTPLYKYCQENDLLNFNDYARFDQREQVMKSQLTTADVKELTRDLYKSFASPQFIIKKILSIHSLDDIKFLARAGIKLIGHLTDFGK